MQRIHTQVLQQLLEADPAVRPVVPSNVWNIRKAAASQAAAEAAAASQAVDGEDGGEVMNN